MKPVGLKRILMYSPKTAEGVPSRRPGALPGETTGLRNAPGWKGWGRAQFEATEWAKSFVAWRTGRAGESRVTNREYP